MKNFLLMLLAVLIMGCTACKKGDTPLETTTVSTNLVDTVGLKAFMTKGGGTINSHRTDSLLKIWDAMHPVSGKGGMTNVATVSDGVKTIVTECSTIKSYEVNWRLGDDTYINGSIAKDYLATQYNMTDTLSIKSFEGANQDEIDAYKFANTSTQMNAGKDSIIVTNSEGKNGYWAKYTYNIVTKTTCIEK